MPSVHQHDKEWVFKQLLPLPRLIRNKLMRLYSRQSDRKASNDFLRVTIEQIKNHLPDGFSGVSLKWSEDDLRKEAEICSKKCFYLSHSRCPFTGKIIQSFTNKSSPHNLDDNHLSLNEYNPTLTKQCESLDRYAKFKGVTPPSIKISKNDSIDIQNGKYVAFKNRMSDKNWWLRALRKAQAIKLETAFHAANLINSKSGIYASDLSVYRRKDQIQRNHKTLEGFRATNELGDCFTLADLSDKNSSNPEIRRTELMVHIRGIEDSANKENLKGLFITFTCPSKYHRAFSKSGDPNPKWGGYTPLDGQNYLNNNWERIRSSFQRAGIKPIGLRVVEPQHDGTPHWHQLLFVDPAKVKEMVRICRRYALEENGNEPGAQKHRFDVVEIDPSKGSATGYIAKYISKNINGFNLESGVYGENPIKAAQRIDTWRSVWGIRQFQFIGGASITVWRELRRLSEDKEFPEEFENIRKAADESNWCEFNELMGGYFCSRKDQKIRPFYAFKVDITTGEQSKNRFGDGFIEKLYGVIYCGEKIITRFHEWTIEKIGLIEHESLGVL